MAPTTRSSGRAVKQPERYQDYDTSTGRRSASQASQPCSLSTQQQQHGPEVSSQPVESSQETQQSQDDKVKRMKEALRRNLGKPRVDGASERSAGDGKLHNSQDDQQAGNILDRLLACM